MGSACNNHPGERNSKRPRGPSGGMVQGLATADGFEEVSMSRIRQVPMVAFALALTVFASACHKKSDDKDEFAEQEKQVVAKAKPLLGIYQITAATRNPKACTAEGPALDLKDRDGYVVLVMGEMIGRQALMAYSCKSVAVCKQHAKKWSGGTFSYGFREITDGKLTAREFFTGFSRKGKCERGAVSKILLVPDGPGIKITVHKTQVDYPAGPDKMCSTRTVRRLVKGKPCSQLTVYRAKKISGL